MRWHVGVSLFVCVFVCILLFDIVSPVVLVGNSWLLASMSKSEQIFTIKVGQSPHSDYMQKHQWTDKSNNIFSITNLMSVFA